MEIEKQGFRFCLAYCLNGQNEGNYCFMLQGLLDEDGNRPLLYEKYFKNISSAEKYLSGVVGK